MDVGTITAKENWRYRWAPSLGRLEGTAEEMWGIEKYNPDIDQDCSVVFFGLYGLPDFYTLWRHKGPKYILWAGTDITHFKNGYWLEDSKEGVKLDPRILALWIVRHCESWVENEVEVKELAKFGIISKVCPSFLGNVDEYEISFKPGNKLYTSVSGDNFELYGWDKIPTLAKENPDIEFHLYGNETYIPFNNPFAPNIKVHGRVPKEQMNAEIKEMQGGLRLTEFDGFSEILGKSILWGQWPVSLIEYPHILKLKQIREILDKKEPNIEGREYYKKLLNRYPWNQKVVNLKKI